MKISRLDIFTNTLHALGIVTQVRETKKTIKSGKYTYIKDEDIIIKETIDVEYIGGKYEKVKKIIIFVIEKTMGIIKIINKETSRVIINFKHKTEPLVLV